MKLKARLILVLTFLIALLAGCAAPAAEPVSQNSDQTLITVFRPPT